MVPKELTDRALAFAIECDVNDRFYAIHSQTEGEVGRVVLGTTEAHMDQILTYDVNGGVYVGNEREAQIIHSQYTDLCQRLARAHGLTNKPVDTTEIVKNEPHSKGQVHHMDNNPGMWNMIAPLVRRCPITIVREQAYQDYPANMGPNSWIPRGWNSLPSLHLEWEVGDMLMLKSNAIHAGPPTGVDRRYVLFGSEQTKRPGEYTDTDVITEGKFFRKMRMSRR